MIPFFLLMGCVLERVTGQAEPLDARFYAAVEQEQGAPGVGGGDSIPFSGDDGPKVWVKGEVIAAEETAIDLDVRTMDPTAPGGMAQEGKLLLSRPGSFELEVPLGLGLLELQAFQDRAKDGPSSEDPFVQLTVEVEDTDVLGLTMTLKEGGFSGSGGPQHAPAPPGAPGGAPRDALDAPASGEPNGGEPPPNEEKPARPSPGGSGGDPFSGHAGGRITVRGELKVDGEQAVDLDFFQPDTKAPGGRKMLGKMKLDPGDYAIKVPTDFGPLILEAFVDLAGDGPGQGDPMGRYAKNPLMVEDEDIEGVVIRLVVTEDGRMPDDRPPPRPADNLD